MGTDNKAVARYEYVGRWIGQHPTGNYVLFTDHERVVGELELKWKLACSEANDYGGQRDQAIKERDAALDSLDANWVIHQRVVNAESDLAASRAEVEGLRLGWSEIKHSIQQANVPGNDWKRELRLISNIVDAAMEKSNG